MGNCKDCLCFVPNFPKAPIGSCTELGDEILIAEHKTIVDTSEEDGCPLSCEVGENFGCINWKHNFIEDLRTK
jgi:hypothetical protein